MLAVHFPNTHCRILTAVPQPFPSVCSGFPSCLPWTEISYRQKRSGISAEREDYEEGWSPVVGLGPKGEKRKWVELSGRKGLGVGETWGNNKNWVREWSGVVGSKERESAVDSLRNLEVPSGVRGPKDRAHRPLTQIPLLANIPVLQIYELLRNNNCQRPEAKAGSVPLSSGDYRHWKWVQTWMSRMWRLTCDFDLTAAQTTQSTRGGCYTFHLRT